MCTYAILLKETMFSSIWIEKWHMWAITLEPSNGGRDRVFAWRVTRDVTRQEIGMVCVDRRHQWYGAISLKLWLLAGLNALNGCFSFQLAHNSPTSQIPQYNCPISHNTPLWNRTWWCHQMETFYTLLALCERNPPVTGGFSSIRPVTRSFDVFFDLCLNKRLSKQSRRCWFETPSRSLSRHFNDAHISVPKWCIVWYGTGALLN